MRASKAHVGKCASPPRSAPGLEPNHTAVGTVAGDLLRATGLGIRTGHTDSARVPDNAGGDDLARHLLRVVEEGRRTGPHKLVLLLALLDVVTERPRVESIPVRELARPILGQLWQQVSDFVPPSAAAPGPLRQMRPNGRGAFTFWELTANAPETSEALGLAALTELERARPDLVAQLEDDVVAAAVKNPVPRFQRIDGDLIEFLYHWPWGTDRSPRAVARAQGRADDEPHLEFVAWAAGFDRRAGPAQPGSEVSRIALALRCVPVRRDSQGDWEGSSYDRGCCMGALPGLCPLVLRFPSARNAGSTGLCTVPAVGPGAGTSLWLKRWEAA